MSIQTHTPFIHNTTIITSTSTATHRQGNCRDPRGWYKTDWCGYELSHADAVKKLPRTIAAKATIMWQRQGYLMYHHHHQWSTAGTLNDDDHHHHHRLMIKTS